MQFTILVPLKKSSQMSNSFLTYRVPRAVWSLELPSSMVLMLSSHAQKSRWSKESVGQLYSADLHSDTVRVDAVTKLQSTWSGHAGVRFDIRAVNKERAMFFQKGFHCLGFWHSHPEPIPTPSREDISMVADHARAGREQFSGIVFIIVGNAPAPEGLGVWVHDGVSLLQAVHA